MSFLNDFNLLFSSYKYAYTFHVAFQTQSSFRTYYLTRKYNFHLHCTYFRIHFSKQRHRLFPTIVTSLMFQILVSSLSSQPHLVQASSSSNKYFNSLVILFVSIFTWKKIAYFVFYLFPFCLPRIVNIIDLNSKTVSHKKLTNFL